jgi:hypothetical protein
LTLYPIAVYELPHPGPHSTLRMTALCCSRSSFPVTLVGGLPLLASSDRLHAAAASLMHLRPARMRSDEMLLLCAFFLRSLPKRDQSYASNLTNHIRNCLCPESHRHPLCNASYRQSACIWRVEPDHGSRCRPVNTCQTFGAACSSHGSNHLTYCILKKKIGTMLCLYSGHFTIVNAMPVESTHYFMC